MRRWASFAVALLALTGAALAAPSADDKAAVQKTITGQIEALRRDDGAGAFGYAADSIREMFQTPETFMEMVKRGYQPVYRQKSFVFGAISEEGESLVQDVLIVDAEGRSWTARYTLTRAPDGTLRISGCQLVESAGLSI